MAETKGFRESSLNDSGELDAKKAVLRLLVVLFICSICFFCFVFFLYLCVTSPQKKKTCVTRAWTCLKIAYWLKEDWVRRFQHGKQLEQDSYSRQRCFCCNNRGSSKCIFKHSFSSRKGQVRAKMLKILKLFSR